MVDKTSESQTGGDSRPRRRRSSRPVGAPVPRTRASSPYAASTTSTTPSTPQPPAPPAPPTSGTHTPDTPPRRRRRKRRKQPPKTGATTATTSTTGTTTGGSTTSPTGTRATSASRQKETTSRIVFDADGVAGKAPKRYTRSAQKGKRPVTRSLTKQQVRRGRGRTFPETSAGGLVLRNAHRAYNHRTNRVTLATITVPVIGRKDRRGRMLWSLPKGHIEDYETVPMTAIREVREETGIDGEIIKPLGTIDYWFLSDGKRIHKTVHHYLMRYQGGTLSHADPEISTVKWVALPALATTLSYADERTLARRATGVVAFWIREEYPTSSPTTPPACTSTPTSTPTPTH